MLRLTDYAFFEEELSRIYAEIETEIVTYLAKRIHWGQMPDPSSWRIGKLADIDAVRKGLGTILARLSKAKREDLEKAVEDIVRESFREDNQFVEDIRAFARSEVGNALNTIPEKVMAARVAAIFRTCRDSLNLTNTGAIEAGIRAYRNAINTAYVSVFEGSDTLASAVRKATRALGGSGLKLTYRSEETGGLTEISLDAGIRRNIVTAVAQATANYTLEDCSSNDIDLVQVSAHAGARPSHQVWQGKIYSISGNSRKYAKLSDATGYGTATGLCGINCKHHFFPYYEGMGKTDWHIDLTASENEGLYENLQKQRGYERNIRAWKRRQAVAKATGDTVDYERNSMFVRRTQAKLRAFVKEYDLPRRYDREQI